MHIVKRARAGIIAAALIGFAVPLATPTPAAAWWARGYGHPGWHAGWHPGWGYGWRGPVGYGPVVVGPVWVRPHWRGRYWVPGHWR